MEATASESNKLGGRSVGCMILIMCVDLETSLPAAFIIITTEMFYAPIVLPAKPRPPELRLHQHQTPVELRLLQAGGRTCVGSWDL
ncbi:hypothetical protein MPTK1_2g12040 [Marchantia polymorpha subsp. ruderalis]|uniref:Uncharacterized protein n=1 Tax=Marchantia polymorpha TaxID=3197 RepID=A0A2R6XCN9_MARPO|nr:hypothetical protein MARPO_0023s0168 [Marchantia polymorpha]BBN02013.1 hypothetical protein Mp_2g12040 [Marchantia polymorpha subsp. ruderalis]|eukprot:PTQ43875.1 hypothetical protein MARPO_0023s0168 [Marchantia polymorpha]